MFWLFIQRLPTGQGCLDWIFPTNVMSQWLKRHDSDVRYKILDIESYCGFLVLHKYENNRMDRLW